MTVFRITAACVLTAVSLLTAPVASASSLCQAISAPAYYWPLANGQSYNPDYAALKLSRVETVIFPGPLSQDPGETDAVYQARIDAFRAMVKDLRASGIRLLGYVSTSYGNRTLTTVRADIARYRQLFAGQYAIDGFFLDETATISAKLPYYKALAVTIRRGAGGYIMLNPGAYPTIPDLFKIGDVTVAFEGTAADYAAAVSPSYAATLPASKIAHIVHTAPDTVQAVRDIVTKARSLNAQYLFVTHLSAAPGVNTFGTLPNQLSKLESEIGLACQ